MVVVDTTAPTIDTATAAASPGPYLVDVPITFTSTTPCTRPCRLIWTYLNGTRLGDRIGEGVSVSQAFSTPGLKTVQLRLTEFCVGTSHLVCASQTLVSVLVEATPVPVDTTAPTFSASGLEAEATGPSTVVNYTFNATDPDDAVVSQVCSPEPGSSFQVGSTTVACTAVDSNGNVGTAAFAVVVADTSGPALLVPGPITVGAKSPRGASVTYTASASDLVDGPVTPNCSMAAGAIFPVGWTTVDCTVSDAHGNRSSASFGVLVTTGPALDGPPPAVIGVKAVNGTAPTVSVPAPIVVNATSPAGAVVRYTVTATDSGGSPVVPICSKPSGAVFPIGAPTVTCTATDSSGHTSPANTFVVQVKGARAQLTDLLARVLHSGLPGHAVADRVRGLIRSFAGRPARLAQTCRLLSGFDKELRESHGTRPAQRGVLSGELVRIANVVGCTHAEHRGKTQ